MDLLDFLTKEELIRFFHCKKTEMSCMAEPNIFLHQLRDHNLVPEKLYKKVVKMRCKEKRKDGVYQILDWLEKERSDSVHLFWTCVFKDHILQKYPVLRLFRNNLIDGSFRVYENLPAPVDQTERENKPVQIKKSTAKEKKRERKRKKRHEEMEEDKQPGPSCPSIPKKKKPAKKLMFFSESTAEMKRSGEEVQDEQKKEGEEEGREEEEDNTGPVHPSVFQAPSLPVSCGSVNGVLYKCRFASGSRSKSIRTEERWFTPEEFVRQELTLIDGHWKKDIRCHSKTLNYLSKKQILIVHSLLCSCNLCSPMEQDLLDEKNDDECFICDSDLGDLLCCDECPRAFHHQCHLPAVQDDSLGEKWMCTFCVLKTKQRCRQPRQMTEKEALDSSISQYILHCEYLLLYMYKEDIDWVFIEDPTKTVSGYSRVITDPMWVDRVTTKLQNKQYKTLGQFVSDVRLIFHNCHIFNKGNKFDKLGSRLSEVFEREFKTIFNIE
ncbi:nuclear body protein SP140-like protein [Pygocentrus nattereri]|uniref:Nuclear body protein SP140-like protein n=2 Tax=Pygocentrus nattereri TaxID=42514 RepID=A0AAR2LT30_PYGNA|nr:nuclear body protein SP140-like protein [Pygocentrus nattereri]